MGKDISQKALIVAPRMSYAAVPPRNVDTTNLRTHPDNPRYFLYRGRPVVLIAASEHYGSVLNRAFDFARYLYEAADKRQTMTRCFLLYRELASELNPHSPCKPLAHEYLAPFPRRGTELSLDGLPKFDLERWDQDYFNRLHDFLSLAARYEILVELVLFSNTYGEHVWALNPFRSENNMNGVGKGHWQEYITQRDQALFSRQKTYVEKIVHEANRYNNIYYEICNEPAVLDVGHATIEEIDRWQDALTSVIRENEATLRNEHMIFREPVLAAQNYALDGLLRDGSVDAVDVHNHELADVSYGGLSYPLGRFMRKDIRLRPIRDLWNACHDVPKAVVFDEDNAASKYRDVDGWIIHRKRAWTVVMSGGHYDFIDFSIQANGLEAGTADSRTAIRSWMKNLSTFMHSFDFVSAKPLPDFLSLKPDDTLSVTLAIPGREYGVYLVDCLEIDMAGYGRSLGDDVSFELPPGSFEVRFYSPAQGEYLPCRALVEGGSTSRLAVPLFRHDIVIHVRRGQSSDAESVTSRCAPTAVPAIDRSSSWAFSNTYPSGACGSSKKTTSY